MLLARVMPCLLLKNKGLVKTIQFKNPNYIGDPINAVWIFNKKEADELVFLDIEATRQNRGPDIEIIGKIADEAFMPVAAGGGVRTIDDIKNLFKAGIEKVVINTQAVKDPVLLKDAADIFGSQSIVAAMDVRKNLFGKYEVYTHGGTQKTGLDPITLARTYQQMGAGELFINNIDRDGTMEGLDIVLIKSVADAVSIPIIACGGAGNLNDISQAIFQGHASAVSAGSLFIYHGRRKAVLINFPMRQELMKIIRE